jgi:hypothetical protein
MFEDHMQGELIFGKKNADPLNDKPEHVQFMDALEEFAARTKFKGPFVSEGDYKDYLTDEIKEKQQKVMFNMENDENNYYLEFFNDNWPEDNPDLYNKKWFEENDVEMTFDSLSSDFDRDRDYSDILSDEGKEQFQNFIPLQADVFSREYGLYDALDDADEEGLSIYRAISIKGDHVFQDLVKQFTGVGYYWSFADDGAVPHSGGSGNTYIISGKVRLQDIDWEATYYKSIYSLREEKEIEVKAGAIIKVEGVEVNGKSLVMERPLFVEP